MGEEADTIVTISFMGGALIPGLPKTVTLPVDKPITVRVLLQRLEHIIPVPDLCAQLMHHYIVVLNGKAIQHLQGWETLVAPGSRVSVVAPLGGGAGPA